MNSISKYICENLKLIRQKSGRSREDIERALVLGTGWLSGMEEGDIVPSADLVAAILRECGYSAKEFFGHLPDLQDGEMFARTLNFSECQEGVNVEFPYGKFDASYVIPNATMAQVEEVLGVLRDGLSRLVSTAADGEDAEEVKAIKMDSVAQAFLTAARVWPNANPSDIWWFIVSRAYCDPFNHPAKFARLNHEQSWKRTSGWALEEVLVRHYGPFLRANDVEIVILPGAEKRTLASNLKLGSRVEADKIDVVLFGRQNKERTFFGVVHVKASFAERRTDDVPLSEALVKAGYYSPLWTMDCKGTPSARPVNRGELGVTLGGDVDRRSAKRKDIEDEGYFSNCFSYNQNTMPTPDKQMTAGGRVFVGNFADPNDHFSQDVLRAWQEFIKR